MPYAHNKKKIPRELDRRVKLSDEDKENIKSMYSFERLSQREIARRFKVSRKLISLTLFPEKLEHERALYKERRKDGQYYDKNKHREYMKKYRHYKQSIKTKLI